MERDFMGLNSKEPSAVGKEEDIRDRGKDSAALSNVLQWPLLNKVSILHHFITPTVAQEDWGKKIGSDPPASSGFMTMSAADAFDLCSKRSVADTQKTVDLHRQGGTHVSIAPYSAQHDRRHHHHDVKMFPSLNQRVTASTSSNTVFRNHIAPAGQKQALDNMKQQLQASVPAVGQHSIFSAVGSVDGIPDKRNCCKSEAPAQQLTIFYAGSVNVFDEISPEKAEAIMLLAGNYGSSTTANKEQSIAHAHVPNSKAVATDVVVGRQNVDTPPCSALSSPTSVSSRPVPQSGNGSASSDELTGAKYAGVSTAPDDKLEPSNAVVSMGPVAAKPMMPSVPQFRKASLARFLEKRKERAMNKAPYSIGMKAQHSSSTLEPRSESDGMGLYTAAGAGSVVMKLP